MENRREGREVRFFSRLEPWPTAIVLFFVVVLGVNVVFIRFSMNSWTGVVTEGAYDKGLAYNRVIEAQQAQDALGWQVTLDDAGVVSGGGQGVLRLKILDARGAPIDGARIEGRVLRPVQQGMDHTFVMTGREPGSYEVWLRLPLPGIWDVKLKIETTAGEYRLAHRLQTRSVGSGG